LEITLEKLRNHLHNLLNNAAVDQVPLPYKAGEEAEEAEEVKMEIDEAVSGGALTQETEEGRTANFSDVDNPVVRRYLREREGIERGCLTWFCE